MSNLSYCNSLKSFIINLIAGEIGFLSVMPISDSETYHNYSLFFENIQKRVKQGLYIDEHCNFYYQKDNKCVFKNFDVDYSKDLKYVLNLTKRINNNNEMIGIINNMSISLNVKAIYEYVGYLFNKDDEYFEVLRELWLSFISLKEKYGNNFEEIKKDKIKNLKKLCFLSDERIKLLDN